MNSQMASPLQIYVQPGPLGNPFPWSPTVTAGKRAAWSNGSPANKQHHVITLSVASFCMADSQASLESFGQLHSSLGMPVTRFFDERIPHHICHVWFCCFSFYIILPSASFCQGTGGTSATHCVRSLRGAGWTRQIDTPLDPRVCKSKDGTSSPTWKQSPCFEE